MTIKRFIVLSQELIVDIGRGALPCLPVNTIRSILVSHF